MTSEQDIIDRIQTIKEELTDHPENEELLNDLGVGYFLIGKYEEAISVLRKAVKKSNSAQHYFNLGNAYSENNNQQLAIDSYLQALDIDPNHIGSLNNLADEYEHSGDTDKAHELFHYLTNLQPADPLSHFNLGNFFLRQNQHIEAAKCYEAAIEKDENFIDAYYNISWILFKAKAYKHGIEYIEKGLTIDPSHVDLNKLKNKLLNANA
ncbi:MAG: tetratricopeptide repeat protein [Balneolaceae bacterium]